MRHVDSRVTLPVRPAMSKTDRRGFAVQTNGPLMDAIVPHPGIGATVSYRHAWNTTGITDMAERHAQVDHDNRTLHTGTQLMARLRAAPDHLRPGQVER